ncbi:MAG: septation regulator SpoVG [Oscillospiraceae bacterium]|nr:septation regulator SpoVG [Oscillospiraceae bacterium]MBQ8378476.1 septation regulator SpoVG [Oscillospiraceae bacterium]MBQ8883380.1 septation regulator SpoVG [Oscillospiraceae bacterium]
MTITDIKVRKTFEDGKLRGVVSVTFDDYFAVHDIKIVQGEERLFVAMPSRRDDSGTFRDIVHPISHEARQVIENSILDAYYSSLS